MTFKSLKQASQQLASMLMTQSKDTLKLVGGLFLLSTVVGCTAGNPYVHDADRDDVITLGDSIFDLSGEIQLFLEEEAGQTFRNYTQSGAELQGGSLAASVVDQYAAAKAANPNIDTIVMDGGGNDILIPAILFDPYGCKTHWWRWDISNSCRNLVDDIYVQAVDMLNGMDADGVQDIIYLGYYYTTGMQSNLAKAVDYGDLRLEQACSFTTANCQFVDPRPVIVPDDIIGDGIHPATTGSRKIADLIWPRLSNVL